MTDPVIDPRLFLYGDAIRAIALDGITPDRRPSRTFVALGPTFAHDCDLLAVAFIDNRLVMQDLIETYAPTDNFPQQVVPAAITVATYQVTFVRVCLPKPDWHPMSGRMNPPPSDAIAAVSAELLTDMLGVWNACVVAWENGTLLSAIEQSNPAFVADQQQLGAKVGELVPFGPVGDSAGGRFTVTVTY